MITTVLSMRELPPTLNEIISVARMNKFASAYLKKKWHTKIGPFVSKLQPIEGKIYLECVWFIKNKRRDQDNITSAQKYILDSLVEQNRIDDDNLGTIQSPVIHHFIPSGFDGFSIVIRDAEAFAERIMDDISKPPECAIESIGNVKSISSEKERFLPKRRVLRRKSNRFKKSARR